MPLFKVKYLVTLVSLPVLILLSNCSQVENEAEEKKEIWQGQKINSRLFITESQVEFEILDADDFGNDTIVKFSASILQRIKEGDNVLLIIRDDLGNYNFINYCQLNADTIYSDLRATISMRNSFKNKGDLLDYLDQGNPKQMELSCSEELNDLYVRVR